MTPPSLRFLGRRVYLGALVVLVSAMTGGVTERRAAAMRWSWSGSVSGVRCSAGGRGGCAPFRETVFWKEARGRLASPWTRHGCRRRCLERFTALADPAGGRPLACLRFLAPITTRGGCAMAA
jgi:hypothetical protein